MSAAPPAASVQVKSAHKGEGETAYADDDFWSNENDDDPLELSRLLIMRHLEEKPEDKQRSSEDK